MSFRGVRLTKLSVFIWQHPVHADMPLVIEFLEETRKIYGGDCSLVPVAPPDLIVPEAAFMRTVRGFMEGIMSRAPHAVLVIEGQGVQQTITRALHTSLFTITGYARRIGIVATLPEAFKRLATLSGADRALWHAEAREHPLLAERMITGITFSTVEGKRRSLA